MTADQDVRAVCESEGMQGVGLYKTIETHLELKFSEPNPFRMDYKWRGTIETVTETRFFERRSGWSGKGIEGPPKVSARMNDAPLDAKRHGPLYRTGKYEKYLIDLGEAIPPRTLIEIATESRYVDEAGSFKPYLSAVGRKSFNALSLTIRTAREVDSLEYIHEIGSVKQSSEIVPPRNIDGLYVYEKFTDSPVPSGRHILQWAWK